MLEIIYDAIISVDFMRQTIIKMIFSSYFRDILTWNASQLISDQEQNKKIFNFPKHTLLLIIQLYLHSQETIHLKTNNIFFFIILFLSENAHIYFSGAHTNSHIHFHHRNLFLKFFYKHRISNIHFYIW
jgi:hypothetical protein